MNRKGFVLAETLVVVIFSLVIFTLLYNSVIPLMARYDELSYYDNLDTTYDVYQYKKLLENDNNFEVITGSDYKKLSCNDFDNVGGCYSLNTIINMTSEDILLYFNTDKVSLIKDDNTINDDIKNYLDYIDLQSNKKMLLLYHDNYLSHIEVENRLPANTYRISYNSKCADEYGKCFFQGTKSVCFGAGSSYYCKDVTGPVNCSWTVFGDPISEAVKSCYLNLTTSPNTYTTGGEITLNTPVRNGYTFDGWTGEGITTPTKNVSISASATGNKKYTANWIPTAYTITYDLNGALPTSQCATEWGTCNFSGTQNVCFGAESSFSCKEVTGPVECSWSVFGDPISGVAKACYINFNYTMYNIQSDAITLKHPTRAGYTFIGWTGSNGTTPELNVTIPAGSMGNKSYTANWTS